MSGLALDWVLDEAIDARHRAFPPVSRHVTIRTVGAQGWGLQDLQMPAMVLKEDALDHNIATMAGYCEAHGVSLAPHGKTTMAPQIFARQLQAGAWAMTAATIAQTRLYREFGVQRILLANELVSPVGLRWVAAELERDPAFEFLCLVDSAEGLEAMASVLRVSGGRRPLAALVELGPPGGRAGCRSPEEALRLAEALEASPYLEFAGFEGYEGVVGQDASPRTMGRVDDFLTMLRTVTEKAIDEGLSTRDEIVVSAGGSAFFDRVIEVLAPLVRFGPRGERTRVRVVLRSGCYVTHDSGKYRRVSPLDGRSAGDERLVAALEVWATVLSRPERELVVLGCGRRDVSYDAGLPVPLATLQSGGVPQPMLGRAEVVRLADQHAFLRVEENSRMAVGDLVALGISHPCTSFDKWPLMPLVDRNYRVTGAVRTFF